MKRLLEKRDAWGNPAAVWILAGVAFLVPFVGYGLTFVRLENNVENWLPADDPLARTYAWYHEHFGAEDKVLISWKGSSPTDPRVERLAAAIRGETDSLGIVRNGSKYAASVLTPGDAIAALEKYDVSKAEALRRLTGLIIGPGGSPAAVVVTLNEAAEADRSAAVEDLRTRAIDAGVPENDLALGGSAVGGSALNNEMKKAAWNSDVSLLAIHRRSPVLLSAIASIAFAFVLLRGVRVTIYVLSATLFATFAAVAIVPPIAGGMNMVLVVMPTLLMVLTLSSAIHVVNYYRHAVQAGKPDPIAAAVQVAWWPCILAGLTTAIGLASLAGSPLSPVRDFGIFSAIGCLIALPVALIALPAALQLWPVSVSAAPPSRGTAWRRLGGIIVRRRRTVVVTGLLVFAAGIYGLKFFKTETKAIRYFPPDARVVRDYMFLEENLSGIVPLETVIVFGKKARESSTFVERLEVVREATESIRKHPEISGALSLADFQPVTLRPAADASFAAKAGYFRRSGIVEKRMKGGESARSFLANCESTPGSLGSAKQPFAMPGDELWRITAHAAIMSDADYTGLTGQISGIVESVLAERADSRHAVTGAIPLLLRTQEAVLDSLVMSFGMAFVMIAAVMMFLLRSVRAGLIAMLPNLLPVAVVFGGISWAGITVDIGTMITASVALGVAVDGTLHLCETFKSYSGRRMSRRRAVSLSLASCGPALWQTAMVVGGGLMMLAWADLLLVQRFGWLMASLVGTALVADLLLLPALLAGPLGRLLMKRKTALPSAPSANPPVPRPHAWNQRRLATAYHRAYDDEELSQ
ncbi:MAG: MMPL family transporter [Planctomycetota bacterium]|nr:MMPL family transporter [Planctomycetaceae bacterium]MDQ3331803.1 MMPL family transporter [Planctomycetota bacterium]